jgi:hypothetical protein
MTSILAAISNLALAFANFFGFKTKKLELNNTPEMKKRAEAQVKIDQRDQIEATPNDDEAIRKDLAD